MCSATGSTSNHGRSRLPVHSSHGSCRRSASASAAASSSVSARCRAASSSAGSRSAVAASGADRNAGGRCGLYSYRTALVSRTSPCAASPAGGMFFRTAGYVIDPTPSAGVRVPGFSVFSLRATNSLSLNHIGHPPTSPPPFRHRPDLPLYPLRAESVDNNCHHPMPRSSGRDPVAQPLQLRAQPKQQRPIPQRLSNHHAPVPHRSGRQSGFGREEARISPP